MFSIDANVHIHAWIIFGTLYSHKHSLVVVFIAIKTMDVLVFEQVGTLKELEFFGESALLGGLKDLTRNATITVESDYVQVLGRIKTCSTAMCTASTASAAAVYSHQTSLLSLFFHSQLPSRSMRCLQCCQGCVLNLWWKKVSLRKT